MESAQEQFFTCPYCGERISMVLDTSAGGQSYIEDCEVCCGPILLEIHMDGGEVTNVTAVRENE